MQVDLTRQRSPKTIERAITDYGETLTKVEHHVFARLVGDGMSATKAYQRVYPEANEGTAAVQGSRLLAHPQMPGMIRDQQLTGRGMVEALVPGAVKELWGQALEGTKDTKPRIDALNSLLDRGGLPRAKELSVHVGLAAHQAASAFDDVEVIDVTGTAQVIEQASPDDLPALEAGELEPGSDALDAARAEWSSVMPPEALRTVDRAASLELPGDEDEDEQPDDESDEQP